MRKIMIFLCFVLLMVIAIFSGCTSTQKISTSGTPPTPKIEYETVLVSPTPSLQMVYDTVAVPVTIPVTAQATIFKGVEQFTANIRMIGNV